MSWHALGDWGTSRLRLFRIEANRVSDRVEGPGALTGDAAQTLRDALAEWRRESAPSLIHLSGMAGARTGLREAPYADCPADATEWRAAALTAQFDSIPLKIAAGLACRDADGRADVMRGEETQIFGACALNAELGQGEHTFILPGTHSKWTRVSDGRVMDFRTFFSGELFALLRQSSLLGGHASTDNADDRAGFTAGLGRARAGAFLGNLFEARAAQLRDGRSADWASGFVSGLVLGTEILEMQARGTAPISPVLVGAPALTARYRIAFEHFNISARCLDGDACVLAGLNLIHADA